MKRAVLIVMAVVVLGGGSALGWHYFAKPKSPEEELLRMNIERVRLSLRDPDSAKFGEVFISKVDGAVFVCGQVNAKNAFGGYTGLSGFISTFETVNFESSSPEGFFPVLWRKFCNGRVP